MSRPHWRVEFAPRARKDLRRLDTSIQRRVIDALESLTSGPQLSGDIKRLAGTTEYRLRVGDWRVRFNIDGERLVVTVIRVLPRGRAYDR